MEDPDKFTKRAQAELQFLQKTCDNIIGNAISARKKLNKLSESKDWSGLLDFEQKEINSILTGLYVKLSIGADQLRDINKYTRSNLFKTIELWKNFE